MRCACQREWEQHGEVASSDPGNGKQERDKRERCPPPHHPDKLSEVSSSVVLNETSCPNICTFKAHGSHDFSVHGQRARLRARTQEIQILAFVRLQQNAHEALVRPESAQTGPSVTRPRYLGRGSIDERTWRRDVSETFHFLGAGTLVWSG